MPSRSKTRRAFSRSIVAAMLVLTACGGSSASETSSEEQSVSAADRPQVGLFTTLPILWAETGDMSEMLNGAGERSWAGDTLQEHAQLLPLDTLETESLNGQQRILLAQPRPLAPTENVALDDWVRAGGRALIFADPMLTRHSRFHIGDRRRPQDVVLLSPILARWGLALGFDDTQPGGERMADAGGEGLPVNLAGTFIVKPGGESAECTISDAGLIARCAIGKGVVTLVADAALFDWEGEGNVPESRAASLTRLTAEALDF